MRECGSSGNSTADDDGAAATAGELDISAELQAEIRKFAADLPEMDCYRVLGVPRSADSDAIRAAFFERSRRFHPDRYFNKRLGPYAGLLHEIYKRIVAANEVLRDTEMRKRYDQSLGKENPFAALLAAHANRPLALPGRQRARPSSGSSLRDRQGLRAPLAGIEGLALQLAQSRAKAKQKFENAKQFAARESWHEAVRAARVALAFDPRDLEFQDGLAEWLPKANAEIARETRARAEAALALNEREEALEAFVEAFDLSPTDADLARRISDLAFGLQDLQRAIQFAECAVALDEENLGHRKLLGFLYRAAGRSEDARRALQRVWEANPMDKEVKAALREL